MNNDTLKIMVTSGNDGYVATINLDDDGLFLAAHKPTQHEAVTTVSKAFSEWPHVPDIDLGDDDPQEPKRSDLTFAESPEGIRSLIETACDEGGTVSISYVSADDDLTIRKVDVEAYGSKLFGGHDHLRGEHRQFRFDRVKNVVRL